MLLTIAETLVHQLRQGAATEGALYGRFRDDDDVAQVLGIGQEAGAYLGRWRVAETLAAPPAPPAADEGLLLVVQGVPPHEHAAYHAADGEWMSIALSVLRLHTDYDARMRGLFESDILRAATVAVIGLGSGGSVVATQLARCGVGQMRLVDYDRLEVQNLARHVCGASDLGRYKSRAVRDLLLEISPLVQVATWEADVLAPASPLAQVLDGCDLVVAATDSEASKLAINRACWPQGIPAVYGAAYNRAFGGDVFRAVPPDGACYECFHAAAAGLFADQPTAAQDFSPGYADPSRMADLVAEPGLAMDIGVIALLVARVSLMVLLRGRTTLPDLPTNWLLFGNRAEWIFRHPLESLFVEVPKRPDCPICNPYESQRIAEMTAEEIQTAARDILAAAAPIQFPNARGEREGEH